MTTFKTFKVKRFGNGYEDISFEDKKFIKQYVTTDKWWNLEHLPINHDPFDLKSFINQLAAYSEEHKNPAAVEFLIATRATRLQETPVYLSHEDYTNLLHLDDIIQLLNRVLDYFNNKLNCNGFVYNLFIVCKISKYSSKRRRTKIPRGLRHEVFKRDNYTCVECGARKEDGATLHVDHKIPVSKGGTDELDNLQTLCSDCNLNKSDVIQ